MRIITWTQSCMCILFATVLVTLFFFWWNESKDIPLQMQSKFINTSLVSEKIVKADLGGTESNFQWGKESTETPIRILQTTTEKGGKRHRLLYPSNRAPFKENLTRKDVRQRFPVWNEDTSVKDLVPRLQQIWKSHLKINKYNTTFLKNSKRRKHATAELLCMLKKVNMDMVKGTDFPDNSPKWTAYLPTTSLAAALGTFKSCAVVSSAGAMKFSKLGPEIDAHDAVLRFNAAPTAGFEADVGTKTTIRLMNSQVVTTPTYNFLTETLYQSGTLVMWDPAPYHASLHEWYRKPEFNFTDNYQLYRTKNPTQAFYIMDPDILWKLWDIIQENTLEDIQPNPPSSGMIGILLMMNLCDKVNVYEYLPSRRKTYICHYYEKFQDAACLLGAFHPLVFEKNLIKQINHGTDENIYLYGKVTVPGLSKNTC
ncbi:beta-galactoside alpha-2,6-sialyltransferase 1-like [Ambystoma mexicanum]|uniref:beta-galactoside alpha-2,6-sialyltransferase 1-like n=1 Tax=Ambystoma mexicanum TaxID=8296 RepID=UPI0037E712F8